MDKAGIGYKFDFIMEGASQVLKQPGYGQIKRADTPINLRVSPRSNLIVWNKSKPSAFESEYTHRTNFVYALCISPLQGANRRQADSS